MNVRCWLDERVDLCLSMELSPGSSFHGILPHPTFKNYFFIWTSSAGAFGLFVYFMPTCLLVGCLLCFDSCTFALLFLIDRVLIHGGEVWRTGRQDTLAHLHDKEV